MESTVSTSESELPSSFSFRSAKDQDSLTTLSMPQSTDVIQSSPPVITLPDSRRKLKLDDTKDTDPNLSPRNSGASDNGMSEVGVSRDGNQLPTSFPCLCGQRFASSTDFMAHAPQCHEFAKTAASFAEAAAAASALAKLSPPGTLIAEPEDSKANGMIIGSIENGKPAQSRAQHLAINKDDCSVGSSGMAVLDLSFRSACFQSNGAKNPHLVQQCRNSGKLSLQTHNRDCNDPPGLAVTASPTFSNQSMYIAGHYPVFGPGYLSQTTLPCVTSSDLSFQPAQFNPPYNAVPLHLSPFNNTPKLSSKSVPTGKSNTTLTCRSLNRDDDICNIPTYDAQVRPFKCCHCIKAFKSKALLDQHMHIHYPPKYTCRYCAKKYRWPPVFYHHQRTCKKRPPTTNGGPDLQTSNAKTTNSKSAMSHSPVITSSYRTKAAPTGGKRSLVSDPDSMGQMLFGSTCANFSFPAHNRATVYKDTKLLVRNYPDLPDPLNYAFQNYPRQNPISNLASFGSLNLLTNSVSSCRSVNEATIAPSINSPWVTNDPGGHSPSDVRPIAFNASGAGLAASLATAVAQRCLFPLSLSNSIPPPPLGLNNFGQPPGSLGSLLHQNNLSLHRSDDRVPCTDTTSSPLWQQKTLFFPPLNDNNEANNQSKLLSSLSALHSGSYSTIGDPSTSTDYLTSNPPGRGCSSSKQKISPSLNLGCICGVKCESLPSYLVHLTRCSVLRQLFSPSTKELSSECKNMSAHLESSMPDSQHVRNLPSVHSSSVLKRGYPNNSELIKPLSVPSIHSSNIPGGIEPVISSERQDQTAFDHIDRLQSTCNFLPTTLDNLGTLLSSTYMNHAQNEASGSFQRLNECVSDTEACEKVNSTELSNSGTHSGNVIKHNDPPDKADPHNDRGQSSLEREGARKWPLKSIPAYKDARFDEISDPLVFKTGDTTNPTIHGTNEMLSNSQKREFWIGRGVRMSSSPETVLEACNSMHTLPDSAHSSPTTYTEATSLVTSVQYSVDVAQRQRICRQCGKQFSSRLSLKQHVEGKHSTVCKYQCSGCTKRYRWGASYYYHKKACHKSRSPSAPKSEGQTGGSNDSNEAMQSAVTDNGTVQLPPNLVENSAAQLCHDDIASNHNSAVRACMVYQFDSNDVPVDAVEAVTNDSVSVITARILNIGV